MHHDENGVGRVPIVEERIVVDKVAAISDRVRVRTTVETREVMVEDVLQRGQLDIERATVNREVDRVPPPREEGDITIISIVEERLLKRMFVVEEIRVRQTTTSEAVSLPTTVRAMRATIEHPEEPPIEGRRKWQI